MCEWRHLCSRHLYTKEWLDKMIFYNKKESKKIEKLTFHDKHAFDFYGGAIQSYQRPFQKLWDGGKFHPQQLSCLRCLFFLQDLTLCRSLGPAKPLPGGDPSHERCNQTKLQEQLRILMPLFFSKFMRTVSFLNAFFPSKRGGSSILQSVQSTLTLKTSSSGFRQPIFRFSHEICFYK